MSGCTLIALLTLSQIPQNVWAQDAYNIAITDISYATIHKNWLFVPEAADLRLEWTVSLQQDSREIYKNPEELPLTYQVYIFSGTTDSEPEIKEVKNAHSILIKNKKVGGKFIFKVRAYAPDLGMVAESELATIVIGKDEFAHDGLMGKDGLYYLHPGRWQLATVGKAEIFDKSTPLGKLAFVFLSITSVLSCLVLIFYSSRTLYLGNIFPYRRSTRNLLWSLFLSCDASYKHRLTKKFKFVLRAWEAIATKSRKVADSAVRNIPASLTATEKMASVDVACLEYWATDGDKAIATIEDIIAFPESAHQINGKKNPDDLLTELVIKIEGNFHDLVASKNGKTKATHFDPEREDIKELVDEIYEPVVHDEKPLSKFRKVMLRKGVFDLEKGLNPFPTSKIIRAGLEIHRMNGHRWLKPTEEVKRAFEDRASNEIEILKRKSRIEWFWNYGALAPLVGLFGTVTGITYAFQQLSQTGAAADFSNTIQLLSNGIFEALWTTIFGLANGIVFVMIYYYYKHKLDWIYSKWEDIYVSITEKL